MLMTEQQPQSTSIVSNSTGELFQQQQVSAGSTLDNGGGDGESSNGGAQRRGVDPSLMVRACFNNYIYFWNNFF